MPGTLRRRWMIRTLWLLPVLPFLVIHGLSLAMDRMEHTPPGAQAFDRPIPIGFTVRIYERRQPKPQGTIILIHGTPGSTFAWMEQFRQPLAGLDIYSYDRPGFGNSGGFRDDPTLAFQTGVLHQALLTQNLKRPVFLVGHSYGAPVAFQSALDYPDRIDGVLAIGGAIDPSLEETLLIQRFGALPLIRNLLPAKARVSNGELITLKADLEQMAARWSQLQAPVVMLHGDQDTNVPVANVAYVEQQMQRHGQSGRFEKRVYPGVNHFIPWQRPELVAEAVSRLQALAAPTRRR